MNIEIQRLYINQVGIEFTYSVNDGDESEMQKMSKDDFAKLLCEHSDNNFRFHETDFEEFISVVDGEQVSEDDFASTKMKVFVFIKSEYQNNNDYCKDCLVKHIQSQNKN